MKTSAKVFVSYAREDANFVKPLRQRLKFLKDEYSIEDWLDQKLVAGQEWSTEIANKLESADIVLLLVSPAFRDSHFITCNELPIALKKKKDEGALIIAILLRPAGWENYKTLNWLEALPLNQAGRLLPVCNWQKRDNAWEAVYTGLKKSLDRFGLLGRMEQDLGTSVRVIKAGAQFCPRYSGKEIIAFNRITDFWSADPTLQEGRLVSIEGTLSRYAPLVIAPPSTKREMHLAFRTKLAEGLPEEREGRVNAMLSFTAGQMVWRLQLPQIQSEYLGLYHSIVRNSVPIFVTHNYFRNFVDPLFLKESRNTLEARVIGRVTQLQNDFVNAFTDESLLGTTIIRPKIISIRNRPNYGLIIDGEDTSIDKLGHTRYLDGDIWVALRWQGKRLFHSRFCDISDDADIAQQTQALKQDIDKQCPGHEVILQFDQVNPRLLGKQALNIEELVNQMF